MRGEIGGGEGGKIKDEMKKNCVGKKDWRQRNKEETRDNLKNKKHIKKANDLKRPGGIFM